jgi:hypothetical protein
MGTTADHRIYQRIPFTQKVKVVAMGRVVAYAVAINIGLGGVLLSAAPLAVGSQCRLTIPVPDGEGIKRILTEGTVVRSDAGGTAVQFAKALESDSFAYLFRESSRISFGSILSGYQAYFRVSRNQDLADCERLLGVSKRTFRTSFYISFFSCISLAVLSVWLLRNSIPAAPNWVKVMFSFFYGAIWLTIIQPAIDLTVFRILRHRHATPA